MSPQQSNAIEMSQFLVQNALLIVIALVAAGSLLMPYINNRRFGPLVTPEQAVELINKQNALLIDVRSESDFRKVRIARSINMPANVIQTRLAEIPKGRVIVLVDNSGNMASPVAKLLRGVGYAQTYILDGGLVGWTREKLPLEY